MCNVDWGNSKEEKVTSITTSMLHLILQKIMLIFIYQNKIWDTLLQKPNQNDGIPNICFDLLDLIL